MTPQLVETGAQCVASNTLGRNSTRFLLELGKACPLGSPLLPPKGLGSCVSKPPPIPLRLPSLQQKHWAQHRHRRASRQSQRHHHG